ncbi:MAG: T9SS type A sorting domain-containing protein [Bacteroidales bacterium]|nr:T9SS type A sorting domain-containing protein [Bacteroidales bacterium]
MKRTITFFLILFFSCSWIMAQEISETTGSEIPAAVKSSYYQHAKNINAQQAGKIETPWENLGPWGGNLRAMQTDPFNSDHVLAGCGNSMASGVGGVYYSNDGGITWEASDLLKMPIYAFESSSNEGEFYAGGKNGIFKSIDGGETWEMIGLSNIFVLEIVLKENNPDVMLAGKSSNKGIIRTTDGGESWDSTPMTAGYMQGHGTTPAAPENMYVVMSGFDDTCLMVTSDNGETFTEIGPGGGSAWDVWIAEDDANHIMLAHDAGIYETTDGGENWDLIYATEGATKGIVEYNGNLFVSIYGRGVAESDDNGASWTLNESPVQKHFATSAGTSAGALFGYWGGIYRSSGIGETYVLSHEGINNTFVHAISYYSDREELWAATEGSGLYVSHDGGLTWEAKNNGLGSLWILSIAPTHHDGVDVDRMLVATQSGVYYSDNHGEDWAPLALEGNQTSSAAVHWTNPDVMWTAGIMGPVAYTEDGGSNWTEATGLPFGMTPRFALAKNENDETRVLIAYEMIAQDAYYSDDMGASFTAAEGSVATYHPMVTVRPESENYDQLVYLATGSGLFLSDYGATYAQVESLNGFLWSVHGKESKIFVGGNNGVFKSEDEGETWNSFNENIDDLGIWSIASAPGGQVFAGTRGRGVYLNDTYVGTNDLTKEGFFEANLYPNPVDENTTLSIALNKNAKVNVSLYNYTGQKVDELYNGNLNKGINKIKLTTNNLKSGTYFCTLMIDDHTHTLKLLKVN